MIYLFSYFAGKYKFLMWAALSLRWLSHLAVGHYVGTILVALTIWLGLPLKLGFSFALLLGFAAFFGFGSYRDFVKIMAFRRRWPVVWNETLSTTNQIQDLDDGHLNRKFAAAPKLGLTYRRNHQAIIFKVRPAVGSTLAVLREQTTDLAAQYKNIDSIEISFNKPSDYQGELKLLLRDTMADVKQASAESTPYATHT